jgi:hypothetical protein
MGCGSSTSTSDAKEFGGTGEFDETSKRVNPYKALRVEHEREDGDFFEVEDATG